MTTPVPDLSSIIPSKWKTWVALIGSGLSFVVPFVLESTQALPAPWPAIVGVLVFLLSALGVYHAPYAPAGTTLAVDPATPVVTDTPIGPVAQQAPQAVAEAVLPEAPAKKYRNPWD